MTVFAIKDIQPNPFRNIDRYPINPEKVNALRESLRTTGFWDNVVARLVKGKPEIAYGHHRLAALKEEYKPNHQVDLIIKDLNDETMIHIMANENMDEWQHAFSIVMETVRAVVQAYADGKIELPPLPAKTSKDRTRYAPSFLIGDGPDVIGTMDQTKPYTTESLANFLDWHEKNGRAKQKLHDAVRALELIEEGILSEADFKDLTIFQARAVVDNTMATLRQREIEANLHEKQAEKVKEPEQKEAARTKAVAAREEGKKKAKVVGKAVSRALKEDKVSTRSAAQVRYKVDRPEKKPVWIDKFTLTLQKQVSKFLDPYMDKKRTSTLEELIENRQFISDHARENLIKTLRMVAARLIDYADQLGNEKRVRKQLER